ncbi:MAG: hypothetical protein ABJD11_06820 [Gemmatimonadota bacterium]
MKTGLRLRLLLILLTLSLGLEGRAAAQATQDSLADAALVELRLGRVTSQTVQAYRAGRDVLLPLTQFFDLAEIGHRAAPDGGLVAQLEPSGLLLTVNPSKDSISLGKRHLQLRPDQFFTRDGEVYLSAAVIGGLLGIEFNTDWSDLEVSVADATPLPVARRLAREAARGRHLGSDDNNTPELALGLERPRWNGIVLDYSVLTPSTDVLGGGAYSSALGMDVLGGSLELGLATEGRPRDGRTRSDASWSGVWRNSRYVTQLRLGDGLSTGPRSRTVRGFSVSNAPFLRPGTLGEINYGGQLGPGWQIEAYRGGRLIAFDSVNALGQFSMDVPIQYGENPVDFIAYGPFGAVREFNRTYRVVGDVLPVRRFEYGVSMGACRTTECSASANVDLRYGLSRRWTVQTGLDQFWRDSLPALSHPYLSLSGSLGNAWGVQLEGVANAVLRQAVRYEPSTDLQLSAEYTTYASSTTAPILTPLGRRNQLTLNSFIRPMPKSGLFVVTGSFDRIESVSGLNTSARVGTSFQLSQIRLLPSVRVERNSLVNGQGRTNAFLALSTFLLPRPELGSFLGKFTARTSYESETSLRTSSVSAFVSRLLTPGLRMETGVSWMRGGLGTTFLLTFQTELPSVRASASVSAPSGSATTATQFVQGSMLYNPSSRKVNFAAGPSMQRAGIAGRVFLDENGNGRMDPDEHGIPGVRVRVGMTSAESDSSGQYRVWDISPYEPVLVVVDSLTLPSPLWTPSYGTISVEAGPNRFRVLDLPVAPGGTLEGRVLEQTVAGMQGAAGLPLLLTNLRTGAVRTIVSFSDGDFYAIGVKPGEYDLSVDPHLLSRLGLTVRSQRISMASSADGAEVTGLEMKLVRGEK